MTALCHNDREIEKLVSDLVAIDSVNPDLVPGGAGERQIAQFISAWLAEAGLQVSTVGDQSGRPSVIGIARGRGAGPALMLNGHIDTVAAGGMPDAHHPRVLDRQLYGRGAYDMKGGVAACMLAAAASVPLNLAGDVLVTAVSDEEHKSAGMRAVLDAVSADAAINTEPTDLEVCVAHKGFVWIEVTSAGRAAHGSRPDMGKDAIVHMGDLLTELRTYGRSLADRAHPLLGAGSIHASLITGGRELSTYPEQCTLLVERRTIPGEPTHEVEREIADIIQRAEHRDPAAALSWRLTWAGDPFEADPDSRIVSALRREAVDVLGRDNSVVGSSMWLDSALIQAAGIPTVVFGPAGGGAHALDEWVDLDSVRACAQTLLQTAVSYCRR